MIPFNLITGFLGSGKTTLLKGTLLQLAQNKRIAVIQNEFAASGVDGKELQMNVPGFKLLEINNGSVFCVCQLNNFVETVQKLISNYQPEIIFLEASGLADPISVVELLQTEELNNKVTLNKIITLIDAPNFSRGLSSLVRFKHQIMIADEIIINKTDLFQGDLNNIKQKIKELNPYANQQQTTFAKVDWSSITDPLEQACKPAEKFIGQKSGGRPEEIAACVLRTHDKISLNNLKLFLEDIKSTCPRIKGFLNLTNNKIASIQTVYNTVQISELENYSGPSELIAFGYNLKVGELRKQFKLFVNKNSKCCENQD